MNLTETLIQWLLNLANFALGFLIGSIITGYFTVKIVVPKIMKNKEIQELLTLFREAKQYLKEILENQKNKDAG